MIKAWTEDAWEDYIYWQTEDRKTLKRINNLIKDIERNKYDGIGKPERLSGDLSAYWSRRIDDCNRQYHIEKQTNKLGCVCSDKYFCFIRNKADTGNQI